MPRQRMNIYLAREWMDALDVLAAQRRVSKSAIIEAAVASFLTPDSADTREAAFVRRLDSMTRKLEKLDRDLAISTEAFALFVRFWLNVTPAPSDALQSAAKISADERFAGFVEVLGRRMAKGRSFAQDISVDIAAHPEWRGEGSPVGGAVSTGVGA